MPFRGASSTGSGCYTSRLQTRESPPPALANGPFHPAQVAAPLSSRLVRCVLWVQAWHTVMLSRRLWTGKEVGRLGESQSSGPWLLSAQPLGHSALPVQVQRPSEEGAD